VCDNCLVATDDDQTAGPPSLRRTAARGSAVTLGAQVVRIIVFLVGTIVLARLIGPEDYCLFAMVVAITGIAEVFRDFGLSMSALRSKDLTQQQHSNLFWLNAAVGAALTVIVFALSWPLAAFYGEPRLVEITQLVSVVYLLGGLTAQFRVHINRSMRFVALAVCDVVPPLIALATAAVIGFFGFGLVALVTQQIATAALTLLLTVILARWRPSLPRRTPGMKNLISFGVAFAATSVLTYATRNVDSIAIGRVWGASQLGLYDRAFQLSVAPINQINVPMSRVAVPVLTRVVDDRKKYIASLREAQLVAGYVTSSVLLVAGGLGVPLVTLLLGPEWAAAGVVFGILAIGSSFRAIQQVSYWMFMTQGLAASQFRLYLLGQPIIIACLLAGLPWGPVGVAIGNALGYVIFWLLALLWVGRVSQLNVLPLMGDALRIVLTWAAPAGVAALAVALFVPLAPIWQVLIGVAAALAWFLIAWALIPRVRRDVATLLRFTRLALGGRS
jgi:O-antigen/teichoic acid export membrane protein